MEKMEVTWAYLVAVICIRKKGQKPIDQCPARLAKRRAKQKMRWVSRKEGESGWMRKPTNGQGEVVVVVGGMKVAGRKRAGAGATWGWI